MLIDFPPSFAMLSFLRAGSGVEDPAEVAEAVASLLARSTVASFPRSATLEQLGTAAALLLDSAATESPLRPWLVGRLLSRAIEIAEAGEPDSQSSETWAVERLMKLMAECLLKAGAQVFKKQR